MYKMTLASSSAWSATTDPAQRAMHSDSQVEAFIKYVSTACNAKSMVLISLNVWCFCQRMLKIYID